MDKENLVGTWKLISAEYRRGDGSAIEYLGENPLGMLVYTAGGRMSIHLVRCDRQKFATDDRLGGTPEDIRAAFQGYLGYYGSFTVDEAQGAVTHHLEACSFPNWNGVDQKRFYQLAGDRLTLRTPPLLIKGEQVEGHLIWERNRERV